MEKECYEVSCFDIDGSKRIWVFPYTREGFAEACRFGEYLTKEHEDYYNFTIKHN